MTETIYQYDIIEYDVWGNDKDGYEVNDAHRNGMVEIPKSMAESCSDGALFSYLRKKYRMLRSIKNKSIKVTGEPEFSLYFNRRQNGYPLGELRRIIEKQ